MKKLEVRTMKKIVVSFLAGALLMVSAQSFGASISQIGKKVDGESKVTLNGTSIGQAVVIQGKSYVPVREITNGLGGKVDSVQGGVISLSSNDSVQNTEVKDSVKADNERLEKETTKKNLIKDIGNSKKEIASTESTIERVTGLVAEYQAKVDKLTSEGIDPLTQNIELKAYTQELGIQKSKLEEQKKKLADLESQLAELDK